MSFLTKEAIGEKLRSFMNRPRRTQELPWERDLVQAMIDINDSKSQAVVFAGPQGAIIDEVPIGPMNGVNRNFATVNAFGAGSLRVFLNGIKLSVGDDYDITGANTYQLYVAPESDESQSVTYTPL